PRVAMSAKGEYYLPALLEIAYAERTPAVAIQADPHEILDFDDRRGLAEAERILRARILDRHMENGVTIADPATTYIDAAVRIAEDVTILPNCYLRGTTEVATGALIGPGTSLRNSFVGRGSEVRHSVIEESRIGANVTVGPFAHLRMH